jgi:hypothetical protein
VLQDGGEEGTRFHLVETGGNPGTIVTWSHEFVGKVPILWIEHTFDNTNCQ